MRRCVTGVFPSPTEETAAIQHEVDADHADNDGVEDDGEQSCRHRHHISRQTFEEAGQIVGQAINLILCEAKLFQVISDSGRPVATLRLKPLIDLIDERAKLLKDGDDEQEVAAAITTSRPM